MATDVENAFSASEPAASFVAEAGVSTSVTSPNGTRVGVASLDPVMERFGFVGLPNAGKSSLYNALAGGGAHAAPYAFATTDPNIGVAKVPDHRLEQLSAMSRSKETIHAAVQFTDIGGLVEGASQGEGLGNAFLSHIREVDAIVFVLRAFPDEDVPGPQDPLEHLRVVEIELALADLASAEKACDKMQRMLKGDSSLKRTVELLTRCVDTLGEGTPLYRAGLDAEERAELKEFFFLTNKPVMAVLHRRGSDRRGGCDRCTGSVGTRRCGSGAAVGAARG